MATIIANESDKIFVLRRCAYFKRKPNQTQATVGFESELMRIQ